MGNNFGYPCSAHAPGEDNVGRQARDNFCCDAKIPRSVGKNASEVDNCSPPRSLKCENFISILVGHFVVVSGYVWVCLKYPLTS